MAWNRFGRVLVASRAERAPNVRSIITSRPMALTFRQFGCASAREHGKRKGA
jgi:hypothetical protein